MTATATATAKNLRSVGLDTSVVLRLLLGEPPAQVDAAMRYLEQRREAGEPLALISDLVISEAFFALQYHYAVPRDRALVALQQLLGDPHLCVAAAAAEVLKSPEAASRQPGFVDRLIHQQYRLDGFGFVTFDKLAGRLAAATVLKD